MPEINIPSLNTLPHKYPLIYRAFYRCRLSATPLRATFDGKSAEMKNKTIKSLLDAMAERAGALRR